MVKKKQEPKKFKVIYDKEIHVDGKKRVPGEVFDNPKSGDIEPLVFNKYIEAVE